MSCSRSDFIHKAESYLGVNEFDKSNHIIIDKYNSINPLPRDYKLSSLDPWRAAFVSVIALETNSLDIVPAESSCTKMLIQAYHRNCLIESNTYKPLISDLVFYDWDDDFRGDCAGVPNYVGIVSQLTDDTITVLQGDLDGYVTYRKIPLNSKHIKSFCTPSFS